MTKVCIYAKESGSAQKRELKEQVKRLKEYCKKKRRGGADSAPPLRQLEARAR